MKELNITKEEWERFIKENGYDEEEIDFDEEYGYMHHDYDNDIYWRNGIF